MGEAETGFAGSRRTHKKEKGWDMFYALNFLFLYIIIQLVQ